MAVTASVETPRLGVDTSRSVRYIPCSVSSDRYHRYRWKRCQGVGGSEPAGQGERDVVEPRLAVWHRAGWDSERCVIISTHGFGGVVDLTVPCVVAGLDRTGIDRPVTALVQRIGWTRGAGPLLEAIGCRPGSPETLMASSSRAITFSFSGRGHQAFRSYRGRNERRFGGAADREPNRSGLMPRRGSEAALG